MNITNTLFEFCRIEVQDEDISTQRSWRIFENILLTIFMRVFGNWWGSNSWFVLYTAKCHWTILILSRSNPDLFKGFELSWQHFWLYFDKKRFTRWQMFCIYFPLRNDYTQGDNIVSQLLQKKAKKYCILKLGHMSLKNLYANFPSFKISILKWSIKMILTLFLC